MPVGSFFYVPPPSKLGPDFPALFYEIRFAQVQKKGGFGHPFLFNIVKRSRNSL
jgi:hypothetical protein